MVLAIIVLSVSGLVYAFFEALFFECLSWDIPAASQCLMEGSGSALTIALVVILVCLAAIMLLAVVSSFFGGGD